MKIIDINMRRVYSPGYLTNCVGKINQTAASFSKKILKRHRYRFEARKLLDLVYLFIPRLHSFMKATTRSDNSAFNQILDQVHGQAGTIYNKYTKIFKRQIRIPRQIIKRAFAGHAHSRDGSHLITKSSIEYQSARTGLDLSPEFRTSKNIFPSARQFEIRRNPQPPDHPSVVFSATVNHLNSPTGAGKVSDPISFLRQGEGTVLRLIQNYFYRNGRISSIQVKRDEGIIPGHAKPILNRVKKNMGGGSILGSASRNFLKGSSKINYLKRKCKTSISKSEIKKTGTVIPKKKTQGFFIQRPIYKAPISPIQEREHTVHTGPFMTGSESKADETINRTPWSAPDNRSPKKKKLYAATKKRITAEIREGLKHFYKPVFKDKGSSSGRGLNSVHTTRAQNLFNQTLINPTRHPIINRIVQKQKRELRNSQIHRHIKLLTKIRAPHFQSSDSNRTATQTVPITMNESLSLQVFPIRNKGNKSIKTFSISSDPINQVFKKAEKDRKTPSASHQVKIWGQPGSIRETRLLYLSSRIGNNYATGFKNKAILAESGSGAGNFWKRQPELDHRTGESFSEQSHLPERQKETLREYMDTMPQQEVNRVAEKVYDLIEKRLSIEQERRGWA